MSSDNVSPTEGSAGVRARETEQAISDQFDALQIQTEGYYARGFAPLQG